MGLEVEGIFTHFATSDTDRDYAEEQFRSFAALLDATCGIGFAPTHCPCRQLCRDADHATYSSRHGALWHYPVWA